MDRGFWDKPQTEQMYFNPYFSHTISMQTKVGFWNAYVQLVSQAFCPLQKWYAGWAMETDTIFLIQAQPAASIHSLTIII